MRAVVRGGDDRIIDAMTLGMVARSAAAPNQRQTNDCQAPSDDSACYAASSSCAVCGPTTATDNSSATRVAISRTSVTLTASSNSIARSGSTGSR